MPTTQRSNELIYARHADELTRFATVMVGPDDAPDVVTTAVLRAFESRQWPSVANPRAYLYRAVMNTARNWRRSAARRRRREQLIAGPVLVTDPEPRPDVRAAIESLSPQQRAVVYLTYWDDLAPEEVAARLGISIGSVRKHLGRARTQLRRRINE